MLRTVNRDVEMGKGAYCPAQYDRDASGLVAMLERGLLARIGFELDLSLLATWQFSADAGGLVGRCH
jgi:hypothetical protein